MSAAPSTSFGNTAHMLLCWFENPNCPSREEVVQIIQSRTSEAVLRSALQVREKTKVQLIGEQYTGNGIVQSCKKVQTGFMLTISITADPERYNESTCDPGALVVDDFLTEEQEAQILQDL